MLTHGRIVGIRSLPITPQAPHPTSGPAPLDSVSDYEGYETTQGYESEVSSINDNADPADSDSDDLQTDSDSDANSTSKIRTVVKVPTTSHTTTASTPGARPPHFTSDLSTDRGIGDTQVLPSTNEHLPQESKDLRPLTPLPTFSQAVARNKAMNRFPPSHTKYKDPESDSDSEEDTYVPALRGCSGPS